MNTSFTNIESEIKSLITSSLSCSCIDSEVRNASTGPNSYLKTLYMKFATDNGVRITFSITENNEVEVLFIGKKGHFSIHDYISKYSIKLNFTESDSFIDKVSKCLDLMTKDKTLSLVIQGQEWPEIPCSFGGMK